jgi:DNA-binding beta-propeller fold protein YncE
MWQIVMIILTSVIDGRTNTVVDNIRVGNMPISVSINPNTNMV